MTDPRFPVLTQRQINTLKEFGTMITLTMKPPYLKAGIVLTTFMLY